MQANEPALYDIEGLAERAGVTRRTVRFYVQRALLPPPLGTGRGNHYNDQHLERLIWIRTRQEQGATLELIERELGLAPEPSLPPPVPVRTEVWTRTSLADGVEIHQRGTRLSARALSRIATIVLEETDSPSPSVPDSQTTPEESK